MSLDRYQGALVGLAVGDALGAPFEGGPIERLLWRLIGRTSEGRQRFTDDTQMSIDLAQSYLQTGELDPSALAAAFAASYRWSRGYGPGAAKILKRIRGGMPWDRAVTSVCPDGSFGNGGAMRAPAVGLIFAEDPAGLVEGASTSARVTHAHPLGVAGAVLIAQAVRHALLDTPPTDWPQVAVEGLTEAEHLDRAARAQAWLSDAAPPPAEVRRVLGSGITAATSCVTSVYVAARFADAPLEDLLDFVRACGGDVDSIGAMAGAIWGARNGRGRIPDALTARVEGVERLDALGEALYAARVGA